MLMFVSVRKRKNSIRITSMKADFSRENIDKMMITTSITSIEKIDLNAENMIENLILIILFNIRIFYCIKAQYKLILYFTNKYKIYKYI